MPANTKYLTPAPWQRFAKISAALVGGFILTTCLHLALATWFDTAIVLITSSFSTFIIWTVLMVCAFLARNGWKVWLYYLLGSILLCGAILLGQALNPILP